MKINVTGKQMNVWENTKQIFEKKLSRLDKFFEANAEAEVTIARKRDRDNIELTISSSGTLYRSEASADSFQSALDRAIDAVENQIRKNKTRLQKRLHKDAFIADTALDEVDEERDFEIRIKTFMLKPMSPEEAILQMNLIGHQFFVFENGESGETCVVYRRKDGGYGMIMPEK